MEQNIIHNNLFSTPLLQAFDVLLQHPDTPLSNTEVSARVVGFQKSSINASLQLLAQLGLTKQDRHGQMRLNGLVAESVLVRTFQLLSNLMHLDPLVSAIQTHCQKIVLFGSRANGTYQADSDFDLFIIADHDRPIYQALRKSSLTKRVQLVIKTSTDMLTFQHDDPVFAAEVLKGVTLWERR